MKRTTRLSIRMLVRLLTTVAVVVGFGSCPSASGTGSDGSDSEESGSSSKVSSKSEAEAAFRAVKSASAFIDGKLSTGFASPASIQGSSGSASASGTKTKSDYTTSYSSTTMRTTNVSITFASFKQASSSAQIDGTAKYYYDYYSKFSTSSSGSASSTKTTQSITSTKLGIRFSSGSKTIQDSLDINMDDPEYGSTWSGTVKGSSGVSYSLSGSY